MKEKGNKNQVVLFNRLTHYNGLVDVKLFDKLLDKFDSFNVFKKILSSKMLVSEIEDDEGNIIFPISFKAKKDMDEFIKQNKNKKIKMKDSSYIVKIKKIQKNRISLYFEEIII